MSKRHMPLIMGGMRCPIPRPARIPLTALIIGLAVILAGFLGLDRTRGGSDNKPAPQPTPSTSASGKPATLEGDTTPVPGADPQHVSVMCAKDLDKAADATLKRIWNGGPYPYPGKDGSVFKNRDDTLPKQKSDYYHEFTVILDPGNLPGNRGTDRIITGGKEDDKIDDYYTDDHYKTFHLIDYGCDGTQKSPAPNTPSPQGKATATPPAGTDLNKVDTMCFKDTNNETRKTLELIWKHADDRNKFPYPKKDGSTFDWRPNDPYPFPKKHDGYYKEWTIPTPGVENRGTQRIVTGGAPSDKIEDYYTSDHYKTFHLIDYGC